VFIILAVKGCIVCNGVLNPLGRAVLKRQIDVYLFYNIALQILDEALFHY